MQSPSTTGASCLGEDRTILPRQKTRMRSLQIRVPVLLHPVLAVPAAMDSPSARGKALMPERSMRYENRTSSAQPMPRLMSTSTEGELCLETSASSERC